MVDIRIAHQSDFHCPVGRTAGDTVNAIHFSRLLIGGEIEVNGVAMFPDDVITATGDYQFVNFVSEQGKFLLFGENYDSHWFFLFSF
jgi:hypothetical protein